jgi:polyhydroxybutyrate depolymerase
MTVFFAAAVLLLATFACAPPDARVGEPRAASPGCQAAGLAPGDYERSIAHGGWSRTYRIHVPPSYRADTPAPLVLSLHGGGSNAAQHARMTGLSEKADRAVRGLSVRARASGACLPHPRTR